MYLNQFVKFVDQLLFSQFYLKLDFRHWFCLGFLLFEKLWFWGGTCHECFCWSQRRIAHRWHSWVLLAAQNRWIMRCCFLPLIRNVRFSFQDILIGCLECFRLWPWVLLLRRLFFDIFLLTAGCSQQITWCFPMAFLESWDGPGHNDWFVSLQWCFISWIDALSLFVHGTLRCSESWWCFRFGICFIMLLIQLVEFWIRLILRSLRVIHGIAESWLRHHWNLGYSRRRLFLLRLALFQIFRRFIWRSVSGLFLCDLLLKSEWFEGIIRWLRHLEVSFMILSSQLLLLGWWDLTCLIRTCLQTDRWWLECELWSLQDILLSFLETQELQFFLDFSELEFMNIYFLLQWIRLIR